MEATYVLEPSDRRTLLRRIYVATVFAIALGVTALFTNLMPQWWQSRVFEGFIAFGCGSIAFGLRRELRAAESSGVTVDDEGIWRAGTDRESNLIPWSHLTALREEQSPYRIVLQDDLGFGGITIAGQVSRFAELRELVVERAALPAPETLPGTPAIEQWFNVLQLVVVGAFVAAPIMLIPISLFLPLGMELIALATMWQLVHTVDSVAVGEEGLELRYSFPRRARQFGWADVDRAALGDRERKGSRWMVVVLSLRGAKRPVEIALSSTNAWTVYRTIRALGARAAGRQQQREPGRS